MRKFTVLICLLMSFVYSFGQDEHLKLRFDFTNVTGAIVKDAVAKYPAKFYAPAKIDSIGDWKILDLGNGGYFDMMQGPGTVMSKLEDFTISICYRVDESVSLSGAGHFLWTISQSGANTETSAAYMGYRLNAQKIAMSPNGWAARQVLKLEANRQKDDGSTCSTARLAQKENYLSTVSV